MPLNRLTGTTTAVLLFLLVFGCGGGVAGDAAHMLAHSSGGLVCDGSLGLKPLRKSVAPDMPYNMLLPVVFCHADVLLLGFLLLFVIVGKVRRLLDFRS